MREAGESRFSDLRLLARKIRGVAGIPRTLVRRHGRICAERPRQHRLHGATCSSTTTAAACEANPLLSAVAEFDDYPSGGSQGLQTQCNVVPVPCGEGQLLKNWIWL